jgi:hypothetical protein
LTTVSSPFFYERRALRELFTLEELGMDPHDEHLLVCDRLKIPICPRCGSFCV